MKRHLLFGLLAGVIALVGWVALRHPVSRAGSTAPSPPATPLPAALPQFVSAKTGELDGASPASAASVRSPTQTGVNAQSAPAAFSRWAQGFVAGDPAASLVRGEALAWQRRAAMLELIETDPERALAQAVPFGWRAALPPNITRHFEQWVDGRGSLEVALAENHDSTKPTVFRWAVINGQRYQAFVYGRRAAQISHADIPLHGIALGGKIALRAEPIRMLESAEAQALELQRKQPRRKVCDVCGKPTGPQVPSVVGDIGGELAWFCGTDHLLLVNQRWLIVERDGGSAKLVAGGGDTWTQGRKSLLYMPVNFPDDLTEPISEAGAYATMDSVNAFYVEGSYNTTWLTATVAPLVTLPQVKAWYSTAGPGSLLGDAREAARKAGFDTANYDFDIVSHTSVPDFDWGGLGYVGGKGTWLQSYGAGVTAHELGHNYGVLHANYWDTSTNNSSGIGPGYNDEYGNIFDTMGAAAAGANHFGALFKNALDWLPDMAIHDITTSGVYRIHPFDAPQRTNGHFYAAKVRKDYDRDYWLEFRTAFAGNRSLQNGILLNWSPWRETGGTSLIDTTPGTLSLSDAAVVIGRTFSDLVAGVHITPLARGATGEEPWIEVQVNLGDFRPNWTPLLKVEVDPTNAAPNQLVRFHATTTDLDGDAFAYSWTFDDGSFSTNNQPWTYRSWPDAGEHVVRCVVSDLRGGVASANVIVTVGQPTGFRVGGIVLDANDDPIEGVRVDTGITNTEGYVSGFTDSDGNFVLVGVTHELTLEATKYGYAFTNVTWQNPIPAGSNFTRADFLALPLVNVSLALSTNLLAENPTTGGQLTLTRTGSTNEDLVVSLFVGGTADPGSDLGFSPALIRGTNTVTIPAGVDRLVFDFASLNDTTVEAAELASITLLEDATYVLAPLAEARITILDDDQPTKPRVSVESLVDLVVERGVDNVAFRVTRNGSTAGDLPVFYAVGGTATAGMDYPTPLGVVIIPAGSSSATVEFRPADDKDVEPDETLALTLTASATYTLGGASASATITDDDLLVVTISPTVAGAAEPSSSGRFTVQRDGDQTENLVVYYNIGGAATSATDYVPLSGAVTIPAGETSADIRLSPLDDSLTEGDESVTLTLTGNPGYDVGTPGKATLYIHDDEKTTVSIMALAGSTAEPGSQFGSFEISRGSVVNGALTVILAINGTAIGGADYVPLDSVVVIPDGSSSVTVEVIPFDDLHLEPTEDVIVTLVASTNYNLGSPRQARVEIQDDDSAAVPAVGFTFSVSSDLESESPGISVSLSETSSAPVSVSYKVLGGTASANDYELPQGTLAFAPGERAKPIPLAVVNDTEVEPNETLRVTLFDPIGATHDGLKLHSYTIIDDDVSAVSVSAPAANASEATGVFGTFRITRTGGTNASQVVNFQVTGTASAPSDYTPLGNAVTFPAGATSVDLRVNPVNDGTVELDETVVLTLISAPGGRIVSPGKATVTILDDDPNRLPVVTIASTNQPHAVEGGVNGAFVFTRSGSTTGALTLVLEVSGTADLSVDCSPLPDQLTIPAGESSITLPVVAVDDDLIEGEETVIIALTVADTYRASFLANATVVIQDNDQNVRLDASDFEAAEPGTDLGGFTFTRFGTTNTDLRVLYTITGTASNGVDYVSLSNAFTIPAGSLAATLPVRPLNDVWVEGSEQVTLTLLSDLAYELAEPATATLTILDDEPMVSLVANPTNVVEGSQVPGVLTVRRSGSPDQEFTARLEIGGAAEYGVDYPPFTTNVFFACGVVAVDLMVFPTNELVVEPDEILTAALVPDPAYTIVAPSNAVMVLADMTTNANLVVTITSPASDLVYLLGTNVNMILEASVTDDGDTNTPLTLTWTNLSGPATLTFGNTDQTNTTVSFTNSGVYELRLTATDGPEGRLSAFADVTVVVDAVARLATNLLHWTFDEGRGTNVFDASGNARDGLIAGAGEWTTNGTLGGALKLSGTNSFVSETGASGFLNGLKQFTLSLWLKAAETNATRGIFSADTNGLNPTLSLGMCMFASCGSATNVMEATFATTRGSTRQVTTGNVITGDWQHVALSWSNGLAPALFINGQLDQSGSWMVPLSGVLYNCPHFVVGRGAADVAETWDGWVDDVRVFPRVLGVAEVGGFVATNFGAVVAVPTNITVQVITPVELSGVVTDDGRPMPPGVLTNTWVQISGPLEVPIPSPHDLTNAVEFTQAGDYVFRLIADDGQVKVFQDLPVTVVEPTTITVSASDSEAAELGPDPGEFTFSRSGDLNFDLTINVALSGTASNGADVVFIEQTNTLVFTTGMDTLTVPVTPFLDHRTEGDETLTFTVISNVSYSIASGEATVTIHDSPYGVWNIAHFTLEELTDPTLSGEGADFDLDGLVNFAEYAASRDPKSLETNAPLVTQIEADPTNGLNHITLTYQRRLAPVDVAYEVIVSEDLVTWHSGTNYVEEIQVVDDGNDLTETVKARLVSPWPSAGNGQFLTVRVWLLATRPQD